MREPKWNEILYCSVCGNTDVQVMAWVNANTDEYISDVDDSEIDSCWCDYCEDHTRLMTLPELWEEFSRMPINNRGGIAGNFLTFPIFTPKSEVLHWFEERCPNGLSDLSKSF